MPDKQAMRYTQSSGPFLPLPPSLKLEGGPTHTNLLSSFPSQCEAYYQSPLLLQASQGLSLPTLMTRTDQFDDASPSDLDLSTLMLFSAPVLIRYRPMVSFPL